MSHEVIIEFYFVVRLCLHRPLPVHLPVCTLSLFLALYHSTMPPTWFSLYLLLKTLLYTSVLTTSCLYYVVQGLGEKRMLCRDF